MSDDENSKKILLFVAIFVVGIILFTEFLFPQLRKFFISKPPNISETSSNPVASPVNNAICNGPFSEQSTINIEPTKAISVVAGDYFTCALTEKGTVRCWGKTTFMSRPFGVFVNDTTSKQSNVPVEIPDLTDIAAITAGSGHACVITKGGAVKCSNSNLQYGHIQNDGKSSFADVFGLTSGVISISASTGLSHTCAVTDGGIVKCWGYNGNGQLGNGTFINSDIPVDVIGLNFKVEAVATGFFHTCVLTKKGAVKCWGNNSHGQLGDGTSNNVNIFTPVDVSGLKNGVKAIAAGQYHTCAITREGGAKCWGYNASGQLGDGTNQQRNSPVDVVGLTMGVKAISLGEYHTCAVTNRGEAKCWGNNFSGQLGIGNNDYRNTPGDVYGLFSGVTAITTGKEHSCAVMKDGTVKCWGINVLGQLGDGRGCYRNTPVDAFGLTAGVTGIAAGFERTCAILSGAVKTWGLNHYVHLYCSDRMYRPCGAPDLSSGITAVAAGRDHACALTENGTVKCWGYNDKGQIGDGTTTSRYKPVDITSLGSGVKAITAGENHTCAITQSGGVKCWGSNNIGQIGDGTTVNGSNRNVMPAYSDTMGPGRDMTALQKNVPVDVSGLSSGIVAIVAGRDHTCALTQGGAVKCWGRTIYALPSDGTYNQRNIPNDIAGLNSGIKAIAAGKDHNCALTKDGVVKCWGYNYIGQLGNGNYSKTENIVNVACLNAGVKAITAGEKHTCALTLNGAVKCWGANDYGQIGDGTNKCSNIPVRVAGLDSGVIVITAGENHTCALTLNGAVKCWGKNMGSQLGDGTYNKTNIPIDAVGFSASH